MGFQFSYSNTDSVYKLFGRHSLRFLKNPKKFANPEATDEIDMLIHFTRRWKHETDPLMGMYDVVSDVSETVRTAEGDCVDYAAVTISYLLRNTTRDMELIVLRPTTNSLKEGNAMGHVIVRNHEYIYDERRRFQLNEYGDYLDKYEYEPIRQINIENSSEYYVNE